MALKYTLDLPAPGASDVATRELNITVDDQNRVEALAGGARSFELLVERDKAVALFLVDVDGSGNRSQPSPTLAFTSKDTIPPPTPGAPEVSKVEQTD